MGLIIYMTLIAAVLVLVLAVVFTQTGKTRRVEESLEQLQELFAAYAEGKAFSQKQLEVIQGTIDNLLADQMDTAVIDYIKGLKNGTVTPPVKLADAMKIHAERHCAKFQQDTQSADAEIEQLQVRIKELENQKSDFLDKLRQQEVQLDDGEQKLEALREELEIAKHSDSQKNSEEKTSREAEALRAQLEDAYRYIDLKKRKELGEKLDVVSTLFVKKFEQLR